jgi:hypothetical protein
MNVITTRAQNLSTGSSIEFAANPDLKLASIDSFQPQADIWVKLRDRPTDYSDDEALLLCEIDAGAWLSWVPGFGQMTLPPGAFYRCM